MPEEIYRKDLTGARLEEVDTDAVLAFLSSCRHERVTGRPGPNVVDLRFARWRFQFVRELRRLGH